MSREADPVGKGDSMFCRKSARTRNNVGKHSVAVRRMCFRAGRLCGGALSNSKLRTRRDDTMPPPGSFGKAAVYHISSWFGLVWYAAAERGMCAQRCGGPLLHIYLTNVQRDDTMLLRVALGREAVSRNHVITLQAGCCRRAAGALHTRQLRKPERV